MPAEATARKITHALELVLRYGSEATSFQTLREGYRYFNYGAEASVAYVETGGAWVAAGGPIAAPEKRSEVASAFLVAARAAGKRACFFGTEQPLVGGFGEAICALGIGEQPIWDPCLWPSTLLKHRSLREQLRRARAKGVSTRLLEANELQSTELRERLTWLYERWLGSHALAPMGFLVQVEPFGFAARRRTFVAEQNGRIIGFAGMIPVPSRAGWFLENLVSDARAPNGTGELLVHGVMEWAKNAECSWLTLGLAPLSGELPRWLRWARKNTRSLYDFIGLRSYKAKFRPLRWGPVYLCYPATQGSLRSLMDALAAFAGGSFVRFGFATLLRGPPVVLGALLLLLLPWTLLLALAPSERWFGASWVKWAWVCFDVALSVGMFYWLRKGHGTLLAILALAVGADAVLTTMEALAWNVWRVQNPCEWFVLAMACAGPTLAAVVLWGARRHRVRYG